MKILIALGHPNPVANAAWARIGFLADSWSKQGHSVEVLGAFSPKSLDKRGSKILGNKTIFNIIPSFDGLVSFIFIINTLLAFLVSTIFLIAKRPNIVIASIPNPPVGLGAMMACRIMRTKYIVDYRDEWEDYSKSLSSNRRCLNGPETSFYSVVKKLVYYLYSDATFVVVVTQAYVKALKKRGLTRIQYIPNGADIITFKPRPQKRVSGRLKLLYMGVIGGYYRLDVALRAIKNLKEQGFDGISLLIAGEGQIQEILSLANELKIENLVRYEGVINDKGKLVALMAEADIGLIPYDDNLLWKNSLPAKFFEYCSCGLPVIATAYKDSLLSNLILKHNIGLYSEPLNVKELTQNIIEICADKNFRETAGLNARRLVEEEFDRNKLGNDYLALIKAS